MENETVRTSVMLARGDKTPVEADQLHPRCIRQFRRPYLAKIRASPLSDMCGARSR